MTIWGRLGLSNTRGRKQAHEASRNKMRVGKIRGRATWSGPKDSFAQSHKPVAHRPIGVGGRSLRPAPATGGPSPSRPPMTAQSAAIKKNPGPSSFGAPKKRKPMSFGRKMFGALSQVSPRPLSESEGKRYAEVEADLKARGFKFQGRSYKDPTRTRDPSGKRKDSDHTYKWTHEDGTRVHVDVGHGKRVLGIHEKKPVLENWMRADDGSGFSAWASEIDHHTQSTGKNPRCPSCRKPLTYSKSLSPKRDREGDVTHWQGSCPSCKAPLLVFNDETEYAGQIVEIFGTGTKITRSIIDQQNSFFNKELPKGAIYHGKEQQAEEPKARPTRRAPRPKYETVSDGVVAKHVKKTAHKALSKQGLLGKILADAFFKPKAVKRIVSEGAQHFIRENVLLFHAPTGKFVGSVARLRDHTGGKSTWYVLDHEMNVVKDLEKEHRTGTGKLRDHAARALGVHPHELKSYGGWGVSLHDIHDLSDQASAGASFHLPDTIDDWRKKWEPVKEDLKDLNISWVTDENPRLSRAQKLKNNLKNQRKMHAKSMAAGNHARADSYAAMIRDTERRLAKVTEETETEATRAQHKKMINIQGELRAHAQGFAKMPGHEEYWRQREREHLRVKRRHQLALNRLKEGAPLTEEDHDIIASKYLREGDEAAAIRHMTEAARIRRNG